MNRNTKSGEPLVSVLVAAYNQEAYICQTLDSLLSQECSFGYEILIGEDCSTDGTRAICVEYEKMHPKKIRLFLNEKNKGLIGNYFGLFEHIKGKYIADCGGDDYWLTPYKLSMQVEILENHPEISMVYGNWQMFHQKNCSVQPNMAGRSDDWFESECFGYEALKNYINGLKIPRVVLSTACFRTDWLKEAMTSHNGLFLGKGIVCEDLPITLCLLKRGPLYMMKEELMVYRVLEESVSHNKNKNDYLRGFAWMAFLQTIGLAYKLGLSPKDIEQYVNGIFPDFVYQAFLRGDKSWMSSIRDASRELGIPFRLKQKVLYFCLQNKFLEVMSRLLYKTLKL